ncbi:T9SS type A sorting domain-containing protein [candidate division KSB1 bacterium]|nr:T9SS type A sorting domain-containing protein [candidate division KSB1 bacterium]
MRYFGSVLYLFCFKRLRILVGCTVNIFLLFQVDTLYSDWSTDPNINTPVCVHPLAQYLPQAITDGKGGMIILWYDERNGDRDIYAQRLNRDGNPLWTFNGISVIKMNGQQLSFSAVSDNNNGVVVVWHDTRNGIAGDIYGQRIDGDGHLLWNPNGGVIAVAQGKQSEPKIAYAGLNTFVVVWVDGRNITSGELYYQKIDLDGKAQWENDLRINPRYSLLSFPRIVDDGAGGAYVGWFELDLTDGYSWLMLQKVDRNGNQVWTLNNFNLLSHFECSPVQYYLLKGDVNGVSVGWEEDCLPCGVMTGRVNSLGQILFKNVAYFSEYSGFDLKMTCDKTGYFYSFVSPVEKWKHCVLIKSHPLDGNMWCSEVMPSVRFSDADYYNAKAINILSDQSAVAIFQHIIWGYSMGLKAQCLDADGKKLWRNDGVSISTGSNEISVISDGDMGTLAALECNQDIFSQRINSDGGLGGAQPSIYIRILEKTFPYYRWVSSPQTNILIPILIHFYKECPINSIQLQISGSNGKLDFLEVEIDSSLAGEYGWSCEANEIEGTIKIWMAGSHEICSDGELVFLKFSVPEGIKGFVPLLLDYAVFNTGEVPFRFASGGVDIRSLIGDVDLNGIIQAYDASMILKSLVGLDTLVPEQIVNADVSLDSTVSALDATLILKYGVGEIDSLPFRPQTGQYNATGQLTMENREIQRGEPFEIPITLSKGDNIQSFEGTIEYDPAATEFKQIIWAEIIKDSMVETNTLNGNIRFAGARGFPGTASGDFATLVFQIRENFYGVHTKISLSELRWNEGIVEADVAACTVHFPTLVSENINAPVQYRLYQNLPNPFNNQTEISYSVSAAGPVVLQIFDITGRLVQSLVHGDQEAGTHRVVWDGSGKNGRAVSTGVYICTMQAGGKFFSKKMIVLK